MHAPHAFWHRESFDRFTRERLPALLAARLPLTGYRVEDAERSCRITVMLADAEAVYTLPRPDADGLFHRWEHPWIVVPLASSEELATAEIACVGEQLAAHIEARLGEIAADLPWDEALIRAVLPLESWGEEIINPTINADPYNIRKTGQWLDITNRLAMLTHQRRVIVPECAQVFPPGQVGRVCPFETPEGPNIGHVFSLALGAVIRDGRIVIEDGAPEAMLGLSAALLPFLEHNEPNHVTFAANQQRQWLPPLAPEPALVRTGNEPDLPGIWGGYNLLTAVVAGDADTYEDAMLISASCAARLHYAAPVEPGDKWSNRHGLKGVISRIVPDAEMPHLPDGTPIEAVYSAAGVLSRQVLGMAREMVMSRVAIAEGQPAMVPPYGAPSSAALRARLAAAGLPEDGLETLTLDGQPLPYRACVGWVYWGRTAHTAADKLHAGERAAAQGELEFLALRDIGAWQTILETYNTRSAERPDAETLAARVAAGPVPQAPPPTPHFAMLTRRLAAVGIAAEFAGDRVGFRFAPGDGLPLALPVPHPWSRERELTALGEIAGVPGWAEVVEANTRLARLRDTGAPESLARQAQARLAAAV
ncbi:MAG TPA: hypothetical protein PK794_08020, partial [Armatimonadota bacterium]|nr:hypothetical protein [Armatimonadota bacterium]